MSGAIAGTAIVRSAIVSGAIAGTAIVRSAIVSSRTFSEPLWRSRATSGSKAPLATLGGEGVVGGL